MDEYCRRPLICVSESSQWTCQVYTPVSALRGKAQCGLLMAAVECGLSLDLTTEFVISRKTPGERPRGNRQSGFHLSFFEPFLFACHFIIFILFYFILFYPDRHISGARQRSSSPLNLFQGLLFRDLTTCIHLRFCTVASASILSVASPVRTTWSSTVRNRNSMLTQASFSSMMPERSVCGLHNS